MVTRAPELSANRPIIEEDGSLTVQSRAYFRVLTDQVLIIDTGSPEGVIEAPQGANYMDDAGVAGAIKYIKRDNDIAGDKTKGWVLV